MKKSFSSRKSAFSLIELAIVLIIIGLLIAGITGGAALIKSAELRAVVTEARANSVSVSAFYSLYDSLPGDSNATVSSTANSTGNANGRIEFCNQTTLAACDTLGESEGNGGAWNHLKAAGVVNLPAVTPAVTTATQTVGTTYPASKLKPGGWVFDYDVANAINVTMLSSPTSFASAVLPASPNNTYMTLANDTIAYDTLLPTDMFSIDTKNDDGNPGQGKIRAYGSTTTCKSGTTYVLTTTTKTCTIGYALDVNG
jgi:prepilin-type N-terminal cleavage/methylation domain-containing protein